MYSLEFLHLKVETFRLHEKHSKPRQKKNSKDANIRINLGIALQQLDDIDQAAYQFSEALALKPNLEKAAILLSSILSRFNLSQPEKLNHTGLVAALSNNTIEKQAIVDISISILKQNSDISEALALLKNEKKEQAACFLLEKKTCKTFKSQLFLEAMQNGKNTDHEFEKLLIALRQYALISIPYDRMQNEKAFFSFLTIFN